MFKPFIGACNNCPRIETWIVIKKGLCQYCNHERKQNRKSSVSLQQSKIRNRDTYGLLSSKLDTSKECDEQLENVNERKSTTASFRDKIYKGINKNSSLSSKKRKPIFKPKKGTGEAQIFAEIAEEREWMCYITEVELKELKASTFAHCLPKALNKYPLFKLYKKNIVLLADEIHYAWDFKPRSELKKDPRFDKLFALEEELKQEYKLLKQKP